MCGLAGVLSKGMFKQEIDTFWNLLQVASFRGIDSTGVAKIQKGLGKDDPITTNVTKQNGMPAVFAESEYAKENDGVFEHSYKTIALIGHCRFATIGSKTVKNAHPFEFEHVIGVQNGTIIRDFKHKNEFETDTEALYYLVNEFGIDEALNRIEAPSTSYALVYYDKRDETLNFIRNAHRPLELVYSENREKLFWGSEAKLLDVILHRNKFYNTKGFKFKDGKTTCAPFTLKENALFSFKVREPESWKHPESRDIKIKKVYVPPKPAFTPLVNEHSGRHVWTQAKGWFEKHTKTTKAVFPFIPVSEPRKFLQNKDGDPVLVPGYRKMMLSFQEYKKLCEIGCSTCQESIDPMFETKQVNVKTKDVTTFRSWDLIGWWNEDTPICQNCIREELWIREYILSEEEEHQENLDKKLHENAEKRMLM